LSFIGLQYSLCLAPCFVFYFYTATYPGILIYRIVDYWEKKYQLFLLDPCYAVNLLTIIVLWAFPSCVPLQQVLFSLASGPVALAVIIFSNKLVFHDIDKVTSVYIHYFPLLICFILRWLPYQASYLWYTPFAVTTNTTNVVDQWLINAPGANWCWLTLVPMAYYAVHVTAVACFRCCWNPSSAYLDSFSYLTASKPLKKLFLRLPEKSKFPLFTFGLIVLGVVKILVAQIFYHFMIAHAALLIIQVIVIIWNAANYYLKVPKVNAAIDKDANEVVVDLTLDQSATRNNERQDGHQFPPHLLAKLPSIVPSDFLVRSEDCDTIHTSSPRPVQSPHKNGFVRNGSIHSNGALSNLSPYNTGLTKVS